MAEEFRKYDDGKLQYSLIPHEAMRDMAGVFTHGANKYGKNNWRLATDTDRWVDALYRHLEAWRAGEHDDQESGHSHLAHALTNIAILITLEEGNDGENNNR